MRIIISPAKKMRADPDSLPWRDLPRFLPQAETLAAALRAMTREELKPSGSAATPSPIRTSGGWRPWTCAAA